MFEDATQDASIRNLCYTLFFKVVQYFGVLGTFNYTNKTLITQTTYQIWKVKVVIDEFLKEVTRKLNS